MEVKKREDFVNKATVGMTIAFIENGSMLSGKIHEVRENEFVVRTKNCSIYFVKKKNVVWVRTGTFWPTGIYNALRHDRFNTRPPKTIKSKTN